MQNKNNRYIALIDMTKETPDTLLSVAIPDFPNCVTVGRNFDDAVQMAHEIIEIWAEEYKEMGKKLPTPRTLEEIKKDWKDWDEWKKADFVVTYVDLLNLPKKKTYLISFDPSIIAKIDRVTKNRSAFLAAAAEKMLKG